MRPLFEDWITPVLFLLGGILFGLLMEKIVLFKMKKWSEKTAWKGDDIVFQALQRMPFLWLVLAGLYGALLTSPVGVQALRALEKILLILTILSITTVLARVAGGLVSLYSRSQEGLLPSASIFTNLVRVFVFALGILMVFNALGINITPVLTALGIGGIAVALALQDSLANLFAGLQILASRQIMPGDFVRLESGEEGFVTDITWRNTTVRTLPNNLVIVPNAKLASTIITNYDRPSKEIAVLVPVSVSYGSDLSRVEQVTVEVAKDVMQQLPGAAPDFEPFIRYNAFGESGIQLTVILRGKEFAEQHPLRHEFIQRLHERYKQEGIEIPFPVRTVYLKQ